VVADLSPSISQNFFVSLNGVTANIPIVAVYPLYKGSLIIQSATTTIPTKYTATSCSTQGTVLVNGQIGCDIVANGTIDVSKSYCVTVNSGKSATLMPDVWGRTNRYYATLYGLSAGDPVNVYVKGATNSILCTPSLNLSPEASVPSIITITPSSGEANTSVTIFGKNLTSASAVNIYYTSGAFLGSFSPTFSDTNNVTFNVNSIFAANTPPGTYNLKIVTPLGITNSLPFTLTAPATSTTSSIKLNSTPTLSLIYDTAGKESQLVGTFNITLTAGSEDINLK
jgi:hypothetical protein